MGGYLPVCQYGPIIREINGKNVGKILKILSGEHVRCFAKQ
jgi:hypothetical protein